jgi:hypothetical protein
MNRTLIFSALALLAFAQAGQAATYRYVDERGRVVYSDTMPPQQAGMGHKELSKEGRVVRDVERSVLTPEEQRRAEAARKRAEQERQQALDAQRRDRALLSSYTSPEEIDHVRDRALELEQLRVTGLQTQMQFAAEKLDKVNAEIAKRQGKPTRVQAQRREEAQQEKAQLDERLAKAKANLETIRAKYDADRQRYLELKAITPR